VKPVTLKDFEKVSKLYENNRPANTPSRNSSSCEHKWKKLVSGPPTGGGNSFSVFQRKIHKIREEIESKTRSAVVSDNNLKYDDYESDEDDGQCRELEEPGEDVLFLPDGMDDSRSISDDTARGLEIDTPSNRKESTQNTQRLLNASRAPAQPPPADDSKEFRDRMLALMEKLAEKI